MSYEFLPGARYRMPSHFGPAPGPRNIPKSEHIDHGQYPLSTVVTLRFRTDAASLEAMMPPGMSLAGAPIVSIDFAYIKAIPWLAGRGYNLCLVSWPGVFRGDRDTATGRFAAVLFESFADPIITGRDELGHPKIYCEIPEPRIQNARHVCSLSWQGYEFVHAEVDLSAAAPVPAVTADDPFHPPHWLQWKYIPGTPPEAGPDASYATISPDPLAAHHYPGIKVDSALCGPGTLQFSTARWEDLPTLYHVANGLAALPMHEITLACVTRSHGWIGDVGDTRRLG
jgi:hypothetical protein